MARREGKGDIDQPVAAEDHALCDDTRVLRGIFPQARVLFTTLSTTLSLLILSLLQLLLLSLLLLL